jgi:hypothetical protein
MRTDFALPIVGRRESEHGVIFWIVVVLINVGLLSLASQQAFMARAIQFSESEYISLVISITFRLLHVQSCTWSTQSVLTYFVRIAFVFAVTMTLLVFLFLPKLVCFRQNGSKNFDAAVKTTLARLHLGPNLCGLMTQMMIRWELG